MGSESALEHIAKMIWTSSDSEGIRLYNLVDFDMIRPFIMKEYIYLKAGLAVRIMYQEAKRSEGEQSAERTAYLLITALKNRFLSSPAYEAYGGARLEFEERVTAYIKPEKDLHGIASVFFLFLNLSAPLEVAKLTEKLNMLEFVTTVDNNLRSRMIKFIRIQDLKSGYGCFSVIACISVLVSILIAFTCF